MILKTYEIENTETCDRIEVCDYYKNGEKIKSDYRFSISIISENSFEELVKKASGNDKFNKIKYEKDFLELIESLINDFKKARIMEEMENETC